MKKYTLLIISLGLTLWVNLYFRAGTIYFPQLKAQAKHSIEQKIYAQAAQTINKKFPQFSAMAKENLIKAFISDYKKHKKQEIKNQLQQEYLKLKDTYQDENGQTYLMELDCWHWARYVDNVRRLGHPGDILLNGRQFDTLMFAPAGFPLRSYNFLFYSSAFLYKGFLLFKQVPLYTFLFYLPLFFTAIFITAVYLFCYQRWGNLAAMLSCTFIGLSSTFLTHSCAGWFDMDILNLLLPFLTVWAYLKAYEVSPLKSKCPWIILASFWLGLFCFTWIGWWFIFVVILVYELFSLLYLTLKYYIDKKDTLPSLKQHLYSVVLFTLFGFFWIILFSGAEPLKILWNDVKLVFSLNRPLAYSLWPNTFSTVDELRKVNFFEIAGFSVGIPLFIASLISMFYLFVRNLRDENHSSAKRECINLFLAWFIILFYGCSRGSRFTVFLLIPLGISLGWVISDTYRYFKSKNNKIIVFIIVAVWAVSNFEIINKISKSAQGIYPLMNDAWYTVLTDIKKNTPKEAVINSWWDFGDWFKTVSKRKVIFDGQSQHYPQAYWMAKVLISNNEKEAIGILRMLNNGGNKAFEVINEYLKDAFKSVFLLEKIIPSQPKAAGETLSNFLPPSAVEEVLRLLFSTPPKAYFIVDPAMQGKMSAISYLGNWNFIKVFLRQHLNKTDEQYASDYFVKLGIDNGLVRNLHQETALISESNINNWLSQRFMFYSGLAKAREQNNMVFFNTGLVYNPKEKTAHIYSQGRYAIPKSLFIFLNSAFEEIAYPNNDLNFSVLIFKKQDEYLSIMLNPALAQSVYTRLYFLNGDGLKYFKPFLQEKDEYGVKVFEINWEGK